MPRGRSLFWLATILGLAATGSWLAQRVNYGPPSLHAIWLPLAIAAVAAVALWVSFNAISRWLQPRRPDAARSIVHLQTVATAIVALVAVGGLMGGFQNVLVGLGIVGFGLTLALQRPILAVAGWAALVLGGSVRVGDRIQVGDLQGDVLDITLFSTRLWEVGSSASASPGRPTGRVVTTSNAVFLEKPVSNATSDTPVVFDEFVVNVALESDLGLARELLANVGTEVIDPQNHARMAIHYRRLTKGLAMEANFPDKPIILMESKPSWMELRLRYLVDARQAGRTQTRLTEAWTVATGQHPEEIPPSYPRTQAQRINALGRPMDV